MGRLAGVPVFLWLVLGPEADGWALALLMLSGITDWLDGYLARRLNQTSQLGQILDPVADRLYILAVVIGLAMREIIPWWVAVILPLRDLLLWGLVPLLRTRGYSALPVHFLGKAATFNLLYAFPLLLLGDGDGPVELASMWLPMELASGTSLASPDLLDESIRHHLQARKKIRFDHAVERISARRPTGEEAGLLQVSPDAPVLNVIVTAYDATARPLQVVDIVLPGDRHEIHDAYPFT